MSPLLPSPSGVLNRDIKKEQKKQCYARSTPADAMRPCGQWAGTQEEKRWRSLLHARQAERIARRKQEKRERKERGARALSSGSSSSGCSGCGSTSDTGTSSTNGGDQTDSSSEEQELEPKPLTNDYALPPVAGRRARIRVPEATGSRVRGADLYVVRLLQDVEYKTRIKEQRRKRNGTQSHVAREFESTPPRYADSRPCWRCLEWMRWAGIKRVFWTNVNGEWEGGKVADLLFGEAPDHVLHLTQYERAAILQRSRHARTVFPTARRDP